MRPEQRASSNAPVRAVLVVIAALAIVLPGRPGPAGASTEDDERRLFELTNESRAQNGLAPLDYDAAASGVARSWADELARSGQLRHNPDLAAHVDAYVTREWTRLGENVGFASSPERVHGAYMSSPGHRANILGSYNRVGVGTARDASGRLWTTVVFLSAPPPAQSVPADTFAPFGSAEAFVTQQFRDVLRRPADSRELGSWRDSLRRGTADPPSMTTMLVSSAESAMVVDPVNRLFLAYFGRSSDAAGERYWIDQLRNGAGLRQVSSAFASSPEFRSTYGDLDDAAFVDLVYRNVLGRPADSTGRSYWTGQLRTGSSDRGALMLGFSESSEYRSVTANRNAVIEAFLALVQRPPDTEALAHWTSQLGSGHPLTDLVATLLDSDEYRARFD